MNTDFSLSLSNPHPARITAVQKISLAAAAAGILLLLLAAIGIGIASSGIFLAISLVLMAGGIVAYAREAYLGQPAGIHNNANWYGSISGRGALAWALGVFLTGFYVLLYWYPAYLGLGADGAANTGLVAFFDPLSQLLKKQPASQWFVYGTLYTLFILAFGIKFIWKYRHNQYQVVRTLSVMFFQTAFAFILPEILLRLNLPYNDFKNIWPLNYYFFFDWHLDELIKSGNFGIFVLFWGVISTLVITPVLTYFYGKRWYCSWVCGCGGLAETAGDPFRHLSDKSLKAWKIERWMVHGVLAFAVLMTAMVLYTRFTGSYNILFLNSYQLSQWYGFLIGAAFSGVVGVGFYPIFGSRVWCRFGCPMAAYLGILQKYFSRFRITVNGGQCISCGNCSTYCEMGIDVKAYAQRGQDIVRASCVGCGICSAVCPRGVLKLENGATDIRSRGVELKALHISEDGVKLL